MLEGELGCLTLQLFPARVEGRFIIESVYGYSVARVACEFFPLVIGQFGLLRHCPLCLQARMGPLQVLHALHGKKLLPLA